MIRVQQNRYFLYILIQVDISQRTSGNITQILLIRLIVSLQLSFGVRPVSWPIFCRGRSYRGNHSTTMWSLASGTGLQHLLQKFDSFGPPKQNFEWQKNVTFPDQLKTQLLLNAFPAALRCLFLLLPPLLCGKPRTCRFAAGGRLLDLR